jgi:hypothetical protein
MDHLIPFLQPLLDAISRGYTASFQLQFDGTLICTRTHQVMAGYVVDDVVSDENTKSDLYCISFPESNLKGTAYLYWDQLYIHSLKNQPI